MKKIFLPLLCLLAGLSCFGQQPVPPAATQAQVNSGTATFPYVSPATLEGWTGGGGGANLTAVTNIANAAAQLSGYVASGIPTPYALVTADSFSGLPNGSPITGIWPDLTGNGNSFGITNVTLSQNGVYGRAALLGNGSTSWGQWLTPIPVGMNTNFTIEVKYFDPVQNLDDILFAAGHTGQNGAIACGWNYLSTQNGAGGSVIFCPDTNTVPYLPNEVWKQWVSHTYLVRYDGTHIDSWLDGVKLQQSYAFGSVPNGAGLAGGLALWDDWTGAFPFPGFYREVAIWTNSLTDAQAWRQQDFDNTLDGGIPVNQVTLIGDSVMVGYGATVQGADNSKLLANALPGWKINPCAFAGGTSTEILNNFTNNVLHNPSTGQKIYIVEAFANNDLNNSTYAQMPAALAIVETNMQTVYQCVHTNGGQVITYPPLSIRWETNGFVTNLTVWLNANWPSVSDYYCSSMTNVYYAQPGAYTNMIYFNPDELHPTSLTMTDMVQNYFAPAVVLLTKNTTNILGNLNVSGSVNANSFTGNGSGLTSLAAANLTGTIPSAGVATNAAGFFAAAPSGGSFINGSANNTTQTNVTVYNMNTATPQTNNYGSGISNVLSVSTGGSVTNYWLTQFGSYTKEQDYTNSTVGLVNVTFPGYVTNGSLSVSGNLTEKQNAYFNQGAVMSAQLNMSGNEIYNCYIVMNGGGIAQAGNISCASVTTTGSTHTPAAVTVTGSPFTFINTTPVNEECYVSGTAAYSLTKNGVAINSSLTSDSYIMLQTNCTLVITYASTAPTMFTNSW